MACHIPLKNFAWTSPHSEVCTQSYGPPKSRKSQFRAFRDSHLGVPGQNDIWVLAPWPGTNNTIRGKVVASPKSKPWWVLWVHVCCGSSVHQKCSNYALTNLLFGLCRSVWVIEPLVARLSPSRSSSTPLYPWNVVSQKTRPNSFSFRYFQLWTRSWVHQRI